MGLRPDAEEVQGKAIKFILDVSDEAWRNEEEEQAEQYQKIHEQISKLEKLLPILKESVEEEMESRST